MLPLIGLYGRPIQLGMKDRIHTDVEKAKALCHSGDLLGCYTILKRYFDRLPFQPEIEHSQLISMFVWCLCELGRDNDLKFYIGQLEKLRRKGETADALYQLGVLHTFGKDASHKAAQELLSQALKLATDDEMRARIKMSLAFIYDRRGNDDTAVKMLIQSIPEVKDPYLKIGLGLWRGLVCYNSGEFLKAEGHFAAVESLLCENPDWYFGFVLDLLRASLCFKAGESLRGVPFLDSARKKLAGKNFKVSLLQLQSAENYLRPKPISDLTEILFDSEGAYLPDTPTTGKLPLEHGSSVRKLLTLLEKDKTMSKDSIVEAIYSRGYGGEPDDKLIYYHVHNLRKFLKRLGVSGEALASHTGGYQLARGVTLKREHV